MIKIKKFFTNIFSSQPVQQTEQKKVGVVEVVLKTCIVCYNHYDYDNKLCKKCNICTSCLNNWFSQLVKDSIADPFAEVNTVKLSCPSCKRVVEKQELEKYQNDFSVSLNAFTELYLKKNSQYISCPSINCKNISWIDSTDCREDFTCPACDLKWKNPNKWTLSKMIRNISFKEIKTFIYKTFFTKSCPNCNVAIIKNGGCKNMHCSRCKTSFCWLCKGKTHYSFSILCFMICLIKGLIFFAGPLNLMLYGYGFYDYVLSGISNVISFENFFYEYGFVSLFKFLFRCSYQIAFIPLVAGLFFSKKIVLLIPVVMDLFLWYYMTRWIEIFYLFNLVAQLAAFIFLFFT